MKRDGFMRLVYCWLCFIVMTTQSNAQELEHVDLGVIEGEFKSFTKTLSWINTGHQTVTVHVWTDNPLLKSSLLESQVLAGASLDIPIRLSLPEMPGDHEYELRLLDDSDIVVHGFQFSLKVLQSEQDVFKAYRNIQWPFRTKEEVFNLRAGMQGDTLKATFDVYNMGGANLELPLLQVGDSLSVHFEPKFLGHNQFGKMTIKLYSDADADPGFQRHIVKLNHKGKLLAALPIQYTILPRPVEEGPVFTTSIVNQDFKVVKKGETRMVDITLANNGLSPLLIQKIESNCDCLTFNEINEIAPGQSAILKVVFNATGRIGLERKTIAIFSNDPKKPVQVLTFRAHVK